MKSLFLSHSSRDSEYVIRVASLLQANVDVFYYEDAQTADKDWLATHDEGLNRSDAMVLFVGERSNDSKWQHQEAEYAARRVVDHGYAVVIVDLVDAGAGRVPQWLPSALHGVFLLRQGFEGWSALACAQQILGALHIPGTFHGLPSNPQIFSYEKDIIDFYRELRSLDPPIFEAWEVLSEEERARRDSMRAKILEGCPLDWPTVVDLSRELRLAGPNPLPESEIGSYRDRSAAVSTAALLKHAASGLDFPEAGPRGDLVFPSVEGQLTVGIVVSGGIAPGINAVIDGIVQRHWRYAGNRYRLNIHGYTEGLFALSRQGTPPLPGDGYHLLYPADKPRVTPPNSLFTSEYAHEGGSILGTHRLAELSDPETRPDALERVVRSLTGVDILYVIGGDGSMKAAHALWTTARRLRTRRPLSVVAIPKTMDNDILWVWQAFGFLSAVEKARETVELLNTEVRSNPRLCVIQLFGSDSGFVVSHAVLASSAGHCQLALIPEVPFSMIGVARHLKGIISQSPRAIPAALVVMAETAIPEDVMCYLGDPEALVNLRNTDLSQEERSAIEQFKTADLGLTLLEEETLRGFATLRRKNRRIEGQTSDALRSAGLKVVTGVLKFLLPVARSSIARPPGPGPSWSHLRIFTNEPRHLLRAIPPSTTDIITGQRLGILAVDNAMAGYTDFMISQWLTEFVLVPLELVVLGRKRIPRDGIFWKSVRTKTGQPENLQAPWPDDSPGTQPEH